MRILIDTEKLEKDKADCCVPLSEWQQGWNDAIDVIMGEALEALSSVQQEQKRGKWINGACNQCGSHAPYWPMAATYYRSNFCPNCGADMRGDDSEIS